MQILNIASSRIIPVLCDSRDNIAYSKSPTVTISDYYPDSAVIGGVHLLCAPSMRDTR